MRCDLRISGTPSRGARGSCPQQTACTSERRCLGRRLPVDLIFSSWTLDDQGTGLPAPQVFENIPNCQNTGRVLLRWHWNAGSGNRIGIAAILGKVGRC
jgi:hypothetical protein